MPRLERRLLALVDDDVATQRYWPMSVNDRGEVMYLASPSDPPMFRIVDSSGKRVAAFGRGGDGPGEFRGPLELINVGESVRILDERMVMPEYRWDGSHVADRPAQLTDIPLAWVGDSVDHWSPPAMIPGRSPVVQRSLPGDTAARVVIGEDDSAFRAVLASAPGAKPLMRLSYAADGERTYLADAYRYRIYLYDRAGRLLTSLGRQLPPHHRGPRELARIRDRILRQPKFTRGPTGKAIALPDQRDRLDTSDREVTPHFDRDPLHIDRSGRLWVIGLTNDSTAVDIFRDTVFLGRITLPCFMSPTGHPIAMSTQWLLLECLLPDEAESSSELQLYRIVESGLR